MPTDRIVELLDEFAEAKDRETQLVILEHLCQLMAEERAQRKRQSARVSAQPGKAQQPGS